MYLTHTHIEENVSLSWGGELYNLWLSIQLILMKKAAKHGAIFSLCRHKIILPQPLPMFDIDNVSCLAVKLNCSHFFLYRYNYRNGSFYIWQKYMYMLLQNSPSHSLFISVRCSRVFDLKLWTSFMFISCVSVHITCKYIQGCISYQCILLTFYFIHIFFCFCIYLECVLPNFQY